ncbi:LppP/LprE family lipoprotein [Tsukamurella ocularis]|uniref:LppP/LprE family lipoprotein n=1 Tax=Tsukamurella ocularis TaxID=1970234 RepID=UPI00216755DC|nr:LppP/LprE family lipoprotein [Tsukamurella ocularis]MCS3782462.1 hypothetical protein [Tsukamurella ocularis]MCS3789986.1 hypothetical protein [Tsukamurella ocularis]MCS3853252.1 hypothetical protein [Tsukamurella ocularis]
MSLGADPHGGRWEIADASNNLLKDGCGLDYLRAIGTGYGDATAPSRVLLFADGRYLGTVEPQPLSYTQVSGHSKNSVTVTYKWLNPQDAFCCATGGPTTVTATYAGDTITRTGNFPPQH